MNYPRWILSSLVSLSLWASLAALAPAQRTHETGSVATLNPTHGLQPIEQPLWAKFTVTVIGLSLIGLELWWFALSKPKAQSTDGIE